MALRDKFRERTQPFLEPGEQIQEIFPARTNAPGLAPLGALATKYWLVAVTDRNIVVLHASKANVNKPKSLVARFPRATRLGPLNGKMFAALNLTVGSETTVVQRRFFDDVERADAAL
jgi:hypothetical protein